MGNYTKGPWLLSEYSDMDGYDCMTGGLQVGPVTLDGADYGQEWFAPENETCPPQMMADAMLISAAPDLLVALQRFVKTARVGSGNKPVTRSARVNCPAGVYHDAIAAIAKALGE